MVRYASLDLVRLRSSSRTPPTSLLCTRSGPDGLERHREPELRRGSRRPARRWRRVHGPHQWHAGGVEQLVDPFGGQPAPAGGLGEEGVDDRMGAVGVEAVEVGNGPGRPAPPLGVGRGAGQGAGRGLGRREGGHCAPASSSSQQWRDLGCGQEAAEHRLVLIGSHATQHVGDGGGRAAKVGVQMTMAASTRSSASTSRSACS